MSPDRQRIVLDTSVVVSGLLLPDSVPARVVKHVLIAGIPLVSKDSLRELASVLGRPKLAPHISPDRAASFVQAFAGVAEFVEITAHVTACRDPDDDKFLSLALLGEADLIVTGDRDLLDLSPFEGIQIVTPRQYLDHKEQE